MGKRTRGCWVRSSNTTSVLCSPLVAQYLFHDRVQGFFRPNETNSRYRSQKNYYSCIFPSLTLKSWVSWEKSLSSSYKMNFHSRVIFSLSGTTFGRCWYRWNCLQLLFFLLFFVRRRYFEIPILQKSIFYILRLKFFNLFLEVGDIFATFIIFTDSDCWIKQMLIANFVGRRHLVSGSNIDSAI